MRCRQRAQRVEMPFADVAGYIWPQLATTFPALAFLDVSDAKKQNAKMLSCICRSLPGLKRLKLGTLEDLHSDGVLRPLGELKHLEALHFNNVVVLTDGSWLVRRTDDVQRQLPRMIKLKFLHFQCVMDSSLIDMLSRFPCLTHLSLCVLTGHCLSDASLQTLSNISTLQYLRICTHDFVLHGVLQELGLDATWFRSRRPEVDVVIKDMHFGEYMGITREWERLFKGA